MKDNECGSGRYSPPCEGGVAATSTKYCEAISDGADRVVNLPKCFAIFSWPRSHPSSCKEGIAQSSSNSPYALASFSLAEAFLSWTG
jgi:hypothetical protein